MSRAYLITLAIITAFFISSCKTTAFTVKTKPSGAKVMLINQEGKQKGQVISDSNFEVTNSEDFFPKDTAQTSVLLLATKEGYKPQLKVLPGIKKGEKNENTPIINLERLSTDISIETSPPGATVRFIDNRGRYVDFLSKEYVSIRNSRIANLVEDHLRDIDQTLKAVSTPTIVTPV